MNDLEAEQEEQKQAEVGSQDEIRDQDMEGSKEIDLGDADPSTFSRRISRDDAQLQKHLVGLEYKDMAGLRAQRSTMANLNSAKTFTEGVLIKGNEDQDEQIFAPNVDIAQSPNQINIDNSDSKEASKNKTSDSKNLLDAIMDEDDDSDSSSEEQKTSAKNNATAGDQEKKELKATGDDDDISEGERQRILDELALDSDDDDDETSSDDEEEEADDSKQQAENKDSMMDDDSIDEIADKSIDSGPSELQEVVDENNYLPFISDKYEFKNDVLEVIDRNERSFKMVAEKMIQKSSQLDQNVVSEEQESQRRLMHFKEYDKVANRFHGDVKVSQGVPYCIAALEDFIAIGSSDGSVRLFDQRDEVEIKTLTTKDLKQNAVFCVDLKRVKGSNLLYIVAGHAKGNVSLYEMKGLPKFASGHNSNLMNTITFKHLKTISDTHQGQVIQVKFYGEFRKENRQIHTVSCDINGTVYLSRYTDNVIGYACNKQCFWRKRLNGPAFTISPLFYDFDRYFDNQIGTFNTDDNPYQNKSFIESQQLDEESSGRRNHLIAFGALERVVLTQVRPTPIELVSIERPDYIEAQTVPYLDWGEGLSPIYRDMTYPILAITWGRTIQLAIWTNHKQLGETPDIKFDGFYICDGFSIDQCFFLDESLLFVLINKKEVRILYTQHFTPGVFDENILKKPSAEQSTDPTVNKKYFLAIKEKFTGLVSTYAEVDKGYRLLQKEEIRHKDIITASTTQLRSKFNFNPTICKNFEGLVVALGKTTVCQGKLLHWEEYLDLIRRTNPGDWLKVLRAALDIFNGKRTGLAGLPDQKEAREHQLRERMKDLLRENIDACIQEFQQGQMVQSKTLRVATEFCIKVGAIDHLFGELFNMFAEAGIEQRYFENLEAFILGGKLKQIAIPHKILTRIIQYYRQKDVELLEKSILNLNLARYPNNLEVRHICEEELLSSALIHMLTTIFDKDKNMENTVCLHILCALFNLMNKSKIERTKQNIMDMLAQAKDSTILFEANQLDEKYEQEEAEQRRLEREEQQRQRQEKLDTEHSRCYIGYKLMWVMRLFLEGKKFPSGTLSTFKWRMYVFDIVRFIITPQFLSWFLNFDPHRFFKLIQPLFLEKEPFQFIADQKSFVEMYKHDVPGLEECATHSKILEVIHTAVHQILEKDKLANEGQISSQCEMIENSYMFFIAKISKKGSQITIDNALCQSTIIQQLKFHRKLLKIELNIEDLMVPQKSSAAMMGKQLAQAIKQKYFLEKPEIDQNVNEKDKPQILYKHLAQKNEQDVLTILKRIEDDIDEDVIKEFCKEGDHCPMFMVRVYLHQLLHNYQKCLTMFFRIKAIKENVFTWLKDIQANILMHNDDQNIFKQMQSLILKNICSFVEMDAVQTVELCDQWFQSEYYQMVEAIDSSYQAARANDVNFKFINTILDMRHQTIMDEYLQTLITGKPDNAMGPSEKYKVLIVRLVQILNEKKYRKRAMEFVQRDYFPINECLEICEGKGAKDASAALYKRKGDYDKAISLYVEVLTEVSIEKVIMALIIQENMQSSFNDPETKNADIRRFDELLTHIIEICEQCSSRKHQEEAEKLWLDSIGQIYKIRENVANKEKFDEADIETFQIFLLTRIQAFMMRMAEFVNLDKIIDVFSEQREDQDQVPIYAEFKPTFEEKVKRETYHENILDNTQGLILKDIMAESVIVDSLRAKGCVINNMRCHKCNQQFISRWDRQNIKMFKCGHNLHQRCVTEDNACPICFNEYDQIQKIIQSRSTKNVIGIRGRPSQGKNVARPDLASSRSSKNTNATTSDSDDDSEQTKNSEDIRKEQLNHSLYSQREESTELERFEKQLLIFEHSLQQKEMYYHQYI